MININHDFRQVSLINVNLEKFEVDGSRKSVKKEEAYKPFGHKLKCGKKDEEIIRSNKSQK